jgi:hypothetical protein
MFIHTMSGKTHFLEYICLFWHEFSGREERPIPLVVEESTLVTMQTAMLQD